MILVAGIVIVDDSALADVAFIRTAVEAYSVTTVDGGAIEGCYDLGLLTTRS